LYVSLIGSNPRPRKGDKGGQLKLTASAFDQRQYASSPCRRAHCYTELAVSSTVVAETLANSLLLIFQLIAVGKAINGNVSVLFSMSLIGNDRCNQAVRPTDLVYRVSCITGNSENYSASPSIITHCVTIDVGLLCNV